MEVGDAPERVWREGVGGAGEEEEEERRGFDGEEREGGGDGGGGEGGLARGVFGEGDVSEHR